MTRPTSAADLRQQIRDTLQGEIDTLHAALADEAFGDRFVVSDAKGNTLYPKMGIDGADAWVPLLPDRRYWYSSDRPTAAHKLDLLRRHSNQPQLFAAAAVMTEREAAGHVLAATTASLAMLDSE